MNRRAFDGNVSSVWRASSDQELCIDLGSETTVAAVIYTPPITGANGLITRYGLYISNSPKQ